MLGIHQYCSLDQSGFVFGGEVTFPNIWNIKEILYTGHLNQAMHIMCVCSYGLHSTEGALKGAVCSLACLQFGIREGVVNRT